jgi:membrane peptidoglycan carboxypeptidase
VKSLGRWLWRLFWLALAAVLALQFWYVGWIVWWRWHNPHASAFMRREQARLSMAQPNATIRQTWIAYEQISPHLKRAVVAAEDAHFAVHEAFQPGDTIELSCVLPDVIEISDFERLLEILGKYKGF